MFMLVIMAVAAAAPEQAFARLNEAQLAPTEAKARLTEFVSAMKAARLERSAVVLLASLAADETQGEGVRAAAREQLVSRAAQDPSVAQMMMAQMMMAAETGKLPPALSLQLARAHLERALQLAPPAEGAAFEGLERTPALVAASAEPLDKELAAELGQAALAPAAPARAAPRASADDEKAAMRELDRARALAASVPAGDPGEGDAREISALAALAAGDAGSAAKDFLAVSQLPVKGGDTASNARRDQAFLQLARLAYQSGDDARAAQLYQRVGRGAPEWLDALFEASWAHFRRGEDERALGNLLTLHAPFFRGRFFPESFVLKALVLYQNCRYADARKALADFQQRYRPLHDAFAAALAKLPTPQSAYEFLAQGPLELQRSEAGEELARIEQEADLAASVAAVSQLAREIDSIDARPAAFRASALAARLSPLARKARIQLIESAGRKLLSRLDAERAELRELLGQSLRLAYEIAGREKELAAAPAEESAAPARRRDPPQIEDDEVLWPFQGEYWRDELGSYRFQLGERCRKAHPPPQQATQPAPEPPKVGSATP
jgi:hypothetical protein